MASVLPHKTNKFVQCDVGKNDHFVYVFDQKSIFMRRKIVNIEKLWPHSEPV